MSTTLRPLQLDFRATRSGSSWLSWLLLALALGFVVDLGVSYQGVQDSIARTQLQIAKLERQRDGAGPGRGRPANIAPEEIAAARETFLRLAMPWNDLFNTLEATRSDKVMLVSIEPDPKAGTVLISGEGKDYPGVLEYVSELQRAKGFNRVHLVRHEVRQNDPQRPAVFSVSASWSDAK